MADYHSTIHRFSKLRVLCIGDIMLDKFIYGQVERISPEAPIPVFSIRDERTMLGGAGNVVRNLISLGAQAVMVAVIGNDAAGHEIESLVSTETLISPRLMTESGRTTTTKIRYVAASQQMLRADKEVRAPVNAEIGRLVIEAALSELDDVNVVILSDYGKGLLTPSVIRSVIEAAQSAKKPVVIDPKSLDFGLYSGATLLSPNLHELSNAARQELRINEDIVKAARTLMREHDIAHMLVTRGKDGMTLVTEAGEAHHIPARAHEVFDVSGAGDTAIATLALGMAAELSVKDAALLANTAAGVVVGRLGTAAISAQDLEAELFVSAHANGSHKIVTLKDALPQVEQWKREGKTVGFTNGCYDLMHSGHLAMLNRTKFYCDKMIVGVNSDASVKRLKGKNRPVNSEMERAFLLASLSVVDMVILFEEDTPIKLLETLKPDVLAKGADYQKHQVVGHELVERYGGRVVLIPLEEGYSTTNIIKRIDSIRS